MTFFGFEKTKQRQPQAKTELRLARRIAVTEALRLRAEDVARRFEGICDVPIFRHHALALGSAVSTTVGSICFNELQLFRDPPFYADIWLRDEAWFDDLAAFLAYQFVIFEIPNDDPNQDKMTSELLSVAATIYTASNRAHEMIRRFGALMSDPEEMRQRHILGVYAGSDDNQARGVVFAFVVNEIVGGPSLELDVNDESKHATMIDPSYSLLLHLWLSRRQIEMIESYRKVALSGKHVSLTEYGAAADRAMAKATAAVRQVFG